MNASPTTTRTKPAISFCASPETTPPIAAAPAPSTTKTTVKPATNGRLEVTTRRATPRSPSRFASTLERAER